MKNSRRTFLKAVSVLSLGLNVFPVFSNINYCKKIPIIIGIGKSGFDVMKLCFNNGIDTKKYLLEQSGDGFSLPFQGLRGLINPEKMGKPTINEFKDFILDWLKYTGVDYNNCSNPIIITNVIGDTYGTLGGRAMFDDLQKCNANVYWVLGFPHREEGKEALKIASKHTHDIAHLPNVVINSIEVDLNGCGSGNSHLAGNMNSSEILFLCIKNIIDKYHGWQGLL